MKTQRIDRLISPRWTLIERERHDYAAHRHRRQPVVTQRLSPRLYRQEAVSAPLDPPADPVEAELARLERLARLMDARFAIPGTRIRFGLDALIGLAPGVGDAVALVPGAWILVRAHALGARRRTLARMAGNLAIDWFAGSIPLVGDIFDVGFRANIRNVALLRAEPSLRLAD